MYFLHAMLVQNCLNRQKFKVINFYKNLHKKKAFERQTRQVLVLFKVDIITVLNGLNKFRIILLSIFQKIAIWIFFNIMTYLYRI